MYTRFLAISALILLVILHQDFWFWTDRKLVFGFLPIGLAYHAGYMVVTSLLMLLLIRVAWPKGLEGIGEEGEGVQTRRERSEP